MRPNRERLLEGDRVEMRDAKRFKWTGEVRASAETGRNGLIAGNHSVSKHHKPRVRVSVRVSDLRTPE